MSFSNKAFHGQCKEPAPGCKVETARLFKWSEVHCLEARAATRQDGEATASNESTRRRMLRSSSSHLLDLYAEV